MKKLIFDTNFLMIPIQFRVDIFSEIQRIIPTHKLCIYQSSVEELKRLLEMSKGKDKKAVQFALKLISLKNIKVLDSKGTYADRAILENLDHNSIIATQDRQLRDKILEKGSSVLILRQKEYLKLVERKLYK